jgi:hypothetical protein
VLTREREALHERIWIQPVRTVAKSFALSDVGLRKICTRAEIPMPERGYRAKLRGGQPIPRPKLPPRAPATPHLVSAPRTTFGRSFAASQTPATTQKPSLPKSDVDGRSRLPIASIRAPACSSIFAVVVGRSIPN